ncbi:FecCD family ABC transporter permease [Gordonia sp. PS3]|uniref:Putative ABC transporter permease protein n=1 Tax=Gordonia sihwensis NBRC 108236 TaxID=1223544 RepID=L7LJ38_9ACTN|nr:MULTISPECIES: iron ABC transporter permease [Gordonia]AUH67924.1 iron ABC transporter permease [Gordonia sp. YC-JH1]KJR07953.1 iron ABC transporter [Gordonia sihwensis]KXT58669.1 iron ABC transporter [Gordonia sp. QH-12]GAC60756.1 putative ABC transporter permease protein [Gordonia sihwensis NBRC 108236]
MTATVRPPITIGVGSARWVVRRRLAACSLAGALLALVLFLIGLSVGFTTPVDVARILLGGGRVAENIVIFDDMLPRVLVAALAGFGLGLAGCLTQVITRNPLAVPDMLGITTGASAGAVLALTSASTGFGGFFANLGVPLSALIGGLATAALMYVLAWTKGQVVTSTLRLILIGVGMTWMMQAAVGYLMSRADLHDAASAQTWIIGSLANTGWSSVPPVAVAAAIGIIWTAIIARTLAVSGLGPDVARALGVRLGVVTYGTLLTAVVVASLAVSAAGPIAFVGLAAPQIAVRLARSSQPTPVFSGVVGACIVLAADIVCRTVLPDGLPVGVVTAAVGGPFLVFMIVQAARKSSV